MVSNLNFMLRVPISISLGRFNLLDMLKEHLTLRAFVKTKLEKMVLL